MDGGEAIRGLLQGGQGFGGHYVGAGEPAGHRPWNTHLPTAFGLTPEEMQELQGLGVDTSGTMMIPTGEITDYRAAKALGGQDFAMWKEQKRAEMRDRLIPPSSRPGSRLGGFDAPGRR